MNPNSFFPDLKNLTEHIGRTPAPETEQVIEGSILKPLRDFSARPSKKMRERLVRLAGQLVRPEGIEPSEAGDPTAFLNSSGSLRKKDQIQLGAQIIEAIHSASLIIDDIEDGSLVRRNQPTLHIQYGVPTALNAGNWLYFWPLKQIRNLGLDEKNELALLSDAIDIMVKAHFGQSIDIGIQVDELPQSSVEEVCLSSIELKTGALMSLAMKIGGYISAASKSQIDALDQVGKELGILLQAFDDLGNFSKNPSTQDPSEVKKYEDLYLRRPSWIWSVAASHLSQVQYQDWIAAVRALPNERPLNEWVEAQNWRGVLKQHAMNRLDRFLARVHQEFSLTSKSAVEQLQALACELLQAYR
ncbi:MAG: polyprenyl synthetase family protein [Bdellovibrionia bacterium]